MAKKKHPTKSYVSLGFAFKYASIKRRSLNMYFLITMPEDSFPLTSHLIGESLLGRFQIPKMLTALGD